MIRFDTLTRTAMAATLHCLTGCAIGEVLGLVIGTWLGLATGATVALAIALAFVFGYAFTVVPVLRSGLTLRRALGVALAADTVSIVAMEVVDNAVMLAVPGAMDAGLGDALFWGALAVALAVAFVLTVPVNRWLLARGRGHALVHGAHHGGAHREPGHAEGVHVDEDEHEHRHGHGGAAPTPAGGHLHAHGR